MENAHRVFACVADALTFCIERLQISAQYRVRIPQCRKDICRRFWLASFLRGLWLVRFELQIVSVDRPNMTYSSWQVSGRACDSVERDLRVSLNNRVFSHDVTAAILVSENNETAAMLVYQTSPLGVELFSYANVFFCSNIFT